MKVVRSILVCVAGLTASSPSIQAQTFEWTGGVGDYNDDSNWNPQGYPNDLTSVIIDNGGTAQVSVESGANNVSIGGSSTLDVLPGASSILSVTGPNFNIGESGTGTLTIGSEALVASHELFLGANLGSTGVLTMDGATLSPDTMYVGYIGTGTLTLQNGSTLDGTTVYVGYNAGSQGFMQLSNSAWTAVADTIRRSITVGLSGTGEVQSTNSSLYAENLLIGQNATGTVTFDGGPLNLSDAIEVGIASNGTLSVGNNAIVSSDGVTIGSQAGSNGNVTIDNSQLDSSADIFVGLSGNGTLESADSQIEAPQIFIARNSGSTGSMTVDGGINTLSGELHVGAEGHGTFTLTGDGTPGNGVLQTDRANMGFAVGSTGIVNVDNATWNNTQAIFVGVSGHGTLGIGPGATIESESGFLAQEKVGVGTANMTGGTWTMTNTLAVGVNGTGNFSASNGSEVFAPFGQLGLNADSSGDVTLNDAAWTNSANLTIGVQGNGVFSASNGSTITSPEIELGSAALTMGTLTVTDSTVNTESILRGSGSGTVNFSGAQLNLLGGSSVLDTQLIEGFASGEVFIGSGGLTIDTLGGNAQIASELTGTGALTKTGAGRLRLNEANTYSGGTTVEGGRLELTGASNVGDGNVTLHTAELSAFSDSTLSGDLNGGIQLISVAGGKTGTFSAATGQTLTLAPLDFLLVAGSTMQVGSAGRDGNVILAPTGAVALTVDSALNIVAGTMTAGNSALSEITAIAENTTVASGATLDFQDQVGEGINALFGAGTVNIGSQSSTQLLVNSGDFSGNIAGNGGLVKETAGTLTLSGQSAFIGGTIVNAGTLIVNGELSFGQGQVTVNTGSTLGGSGLIGTIFLEGGSLAPGNSAGNLTADNLFWETGELVFDLGPSSDLLSLGDLQGLGTTYDFTVVDNGWSVNTTYTLITFEVTNIASVDAFRFTNTGGFDGNFTLNGDHLQFTVTAIPEPSVFLPVVLGFAALCLRKSRCRPSPNVKESCAHHEPMIALRLH